jgi:serine/threonine-protein kinase ULK/ATG1
MGVPIYISPQILSKNYYTYKCDVWSMGIILFEMLFEVLPWRFKDPDHLFSLILANPYPYKEQKPPANPLLLVLL